MDTLDIGPKNVPPQGEMDMVVGLLGGDALFARPVRDRLDAHEIILSGFPNKALRSLVRNVPVMQQPDVMEKALGISLRTFQRRSKADAVRPLSQEQSGRTWKFAEILARATRILGSQTEAEAWLSRPATGLNQQRPIDLLATTAGVEIVEDHLERLEYGVYA
ncbi:MAG TPA: antitoxin Xre/MbcA/ParS toxin-binding domain-containing protein [Asticcacaulis sp.]